MTSHSARIQVFSITCNVLRTCILANRFAYHPRPPIIPVDDAAGELKSADAPVTDDEEQLDADDDDPAADDEELLDADDDPADDDEASWSTLEWLVLVLFSI